MSTGLQLLIYAADVAGSLNTYSALLGGAAIPAAIAAFTLENAGRGTQRAEVANWDTAMANHVLYPSLYRKPATDRPLEGEKSKFTFNLTKPLIIAAIALFSVNVLVPSKGTLYAIAATEVAETVVMSETATKAVNALNRFLDAQMPAEKAAEVATVTVTNAANQ